MEAPLWLQKMFTVDDSILDDQFSLEDGEDESKSSGQNRERGQELRNHEGFSRKETVKEDAIRRTVDRDEADLETIRPRPLSEWIHRAEVERAEEEANDDKLVPVDIDACLEKVKETFHMPDNKDIVIRNFHIGAGTSWRASAVFVDGLVDKNVINSHILEPLMLLSTVTAKDTAHDMRSVEDILLPGNQVSLMQNWEDVVNGILTGMTAVFADGCDAALVMETRGWEHRSVGNPKAEAVVRGPHDAFTESFRTNTGLVRAQLRSPRLITEMMSVGKLAKTDVAVMYIKGLTNDKLVREVKRRIAKIDVDFLADSGVFEQFIEDDPSIMVPQVMSTERPDRVVHMLTEGHVAIFVGNSPFVLVAPVVFWSMMQTSEDAYLKFPFGSFLRLIRWMALGVALLLPALYIAVSNYHPEMLPTDLMLAIAGSREQVPFPVIVEVILMEFAIELIREAGIRIPSVIGPTIGIVGALIIGQSAVQAGIASPILVIVVATTALASFTIPNYNLNLGVRVARFAFLAAAAMFGFYGIALLGIAVLARISVQKSFGVPILAPVAPSMTSSRDVFLRGTAYTMNERPPHTRPQNAWRQQPVTRPWSPKTSPAKSRFGRRGGNT